MQATAGAIATIARAARDVSRSAGHEARRAGWMQGGELQDAEAGGRLGYKGILWHWWCAVVQLCSVHAGGWSARLTPGTAGWEGKGGGGGRGCSCRAAVDLWICGLTYWTLWLLAKDLAGSAAAGVRFAGFAL